MSLRILDRPALERSALLGYPLGMQNIGLMMTYNEDDIIEEVMIANQKHFDKILVLDGSTDRTEDILRSFSNVVYVIKDQDLYPRRVIGNGARQFLLEKAQEWYGHEDWNTPKISKSLNSLSEPTF